MNNDILQQPLYTGTPLIVGEKMYKEIQKWTKEDFEHVSKTIQNVIGWYKGIPIFYKN